MESQTVVSIANGRGIPVTSLFHADTEDKKSNIKSIITNEVRKMEKDPVMLEIKQEPMQVRS